MTEHGAGWSARKQREAANMTHVFKSIAVAALLANPAK